MAKKITFELGPAAIALIAAAAVIGYVLGSSYPFGSAGSTNESLAADQDTQDLGPAPITPATGYGLADIKRWATEVDLDANQFNACFDSQKYLEDIRLEYLEGLEVGVTGTPAFMVGNNENGMVFVTGAQPYDLFKNIIDSYLEGSPPEAEFNLTGDAIRNSSIIGDKEAEVLIIEFSDFQCPFCRAFYTDTLPQIESEYISSGKVALVYKEFPLTSIHPGAVDYGLAAKCAQEQGKWREMHDKIFDEQNKLGVSTIPYA